MTDEQTSRQDGTPEKPRKRRARRGGWFKVHRSLLSHAIFQNEGLLKLAIWCLGKASYKRRWVPIEIGRSQSEVELQPGQFIFGRHRAASDKKLKMAGETIRFRLNKLGKLGFLTIHPTTHYSIVTVTADKIYTKRKSRLHQPSHPPSTSRTPAVHHKEEGMKEGNKEGQSDNHGRRTGWKFWEPIMADFDPKQITHPTSFLPFYERLAGTGIVQAANPDDIENVLFWILLARMADDPIVRFTHNAETHRGPMSSEHKLWKEAKKARDIIMDHLENQKLGLGCG